MELGVLSALVLAPREVRSILASEGVTGAHFHVPAHAEMCDTLCRLLDEGKPLDFLTVTAHFRDSGRLESIGGAAFVSGLFTYLATASNAGFYIEHVLQKRALREVIRIGTEFAARAYEPDEDSAALVGEFHAALTKLAAKKAARLSLREALNQIVKEVANGLDDTGVLDLNTEGVHGRLTVYRGDLLIISAPTSCGKSALADQFAINVAMSGKRSAIYTLEMMQRQTLKRAIARISGDDVDFVRRIVRNANLSGGEPSEFVRTKAAKFKETAVTISKLALHIRDDLFRIESIVADIRAEHGRKPIDFIVIDYLQLIQSSGKFERKQLQIASITQGLKALAKELDCVICMPSQVNKEGGTREAQDAENDASALIKIHPKDNDTGDIEPGRISIWKQREGARHIDLPLVFNPQITRFDYAADKPR